MIDNISREDGECHIWYDIVDCGIHALLEANRNIAVVVSVGPSRRAIVTGLICCSVRPKYRGYCMPLSILFPYIPAADGLGTLGIRSLNIEGINVDVRVMNHLDRISSAGCRTTSGGLRGWEWDRPLPHIWIFANAQKGNAEFFRSPGPDGHASNCLGNNGPLKLDSSITDVIVFGLSYIVLALFMRTAPRLTHS